MFSGSPELLEVFRYFCTSHFETVDDFYRLFFGTVEDTDVKRYGTAREAFRSLNYLSAFPFYSENDKWFRYLRDKVLGDEAYKQLMLDLMKAESFDIAAASKELWMTEENLVALHEAGHAIGLHSYSHPTQMGNLPPERQAKEYRRNMQHLESVIGQGQVISMSHPCGHCNEDTLDILREMGLRIGFRSSLSRTDITSVLGVPREDHENVHRKMRDESHAVQQ